MKAEMFLMRGLFLMVVVIVGLCAANMIRTLHHDGLASVQAQTISAPAQAG